MLTVRGITKRFGSVVALHDVSLEFATGEIHAVLGENGAGKSTLMNILGGFVRPDSGDIQLSGHPLPLGHPAACRDAGIELVHQHFMLVPAFTVEENIALASRQAHSRRALEIAKELGWTIEVRARTGDLPVGTQQRIEILKALAADTPVVIFDEPTATLSPNEVEDLFRVLRALKSNGKTVILIAHKLAEVMRVADRVTVLRRGRKVAEAAISEVDVRQLAEWMVGALPREQRPLPPGDHEAIVRIRDLWVRGDRGEWAVQGVDLDIRPGEILGIGGVDGNGQVELAETIAGIRESKTPIALPPAGYIPPNRQTEGLALTMSIQDNFLIGGLAHKYLARGPFLLLRAITKWAQGLITKYRIRIGNLRDAAATLSGGNQQKIVVARVIDSASPVIVAVHPTRGLDIHATDQVHSALQSAAERGSAVVLFSSDLDELAGVASRTYFMAQGRLVEGFSTALSGAGP